MTTVQNQVVDLGRPWRGVGPFIFASRHVDAYPRGNEDLGPAGDISNRPLGNDFRHPSGWSMYHGTEVPGFPGHPHRGFETITIVRGGFVDHADSTGAGARYGAGDVQWVTAGRGVSHSEMFPLLNTDADNPFELYQIWLNLPASGKKEPPEFTMQWREDIPSVTPADATGDVRVMVIAGDFEGAAPVAPPRASWASNPDADVAVWLIDMAPNSSMTLPATGNAATERLLYVHGDNASVTVDGVRVVEGEGYLQSEQRAVRLETGDAPATILVLQGVPINEPVASYGPFVMNTPEEIQEAFDDYRRTQFGGWPWPSDGPVYERSTPRFAKHGDGRTEYPEG